MSLTITHALTPIQTAFALIRKNYPKRLASFLWKNLGHISPMDVSENYTMLEYAIYLGRYECTRVIVSWIRNKYHRSVVYEDRSLDLAINVQSVSVGLDEDNVQICKYLVEKVFNGRLIYYDFLYPTYTEVEVDDYFGYMTLYPDYTKTLDRVNDFLLYLAEYQNVKTFIYLAGLYMDKIEKDRQLLFDTFWSSDYLTKLQGYSPILHYWMRDQLYQRHVKTWHICGCKTLVEVQTRASQMWDFYNPSPPSFLQIVGRRPFIGDPVSFETRKLIIDLCLCINRFIEVNGINRMSKILKYTIFEYIGDGLQYPMMDSLIPRLLESRR